MKLHLSSMPFFRNNNDEWMSLSGRESIWFCFGVVVVYSGSVWRVRGALDERRARRSRLLGGVRVFLRGEFERSPGRIVRYFTRGLGFRGLLDFLRALLLSGFLELPSGDCRGCCMRGVCRVGEMVCEVECNLVCGELKCGHIS